MSRMSYIDLKIKEIKRWLVDNIVLIWFAFITIVIAVLIYGQANADKSKMQIRENKINYIEIKLQKQMNYIDQLEADVDNLKEVKERKVK